MLFAAIAIIILTAIAAVTIVGHRDGSFAGSQLARVRQAHLAARRGRAHPRPALREGRDHRRGVQPHAGDS